MIELFFIFFVNIYLRKFSIYTINKYIIIKFYIIIICYNNKNFFKNVNFYFLVQPDNLNQINPILIELVCFGFVEKEFKNQTKPIQLNLIGSNLIFT